MAKAPKTPDAKTPASKAKPAKAPVKAASATDALMKQAMQKQEIAKAIAISRAADFTGKADAPAVAAAATADMGASTRGGLKRRPALAGQEALGKGVRVAMMAPAMRISLRARPDAIAALSKALDVSLPKTAKTSSSANGRTALWLGPDEWLVIDETGNDPLADCAGVKALHSAVGVSQRNAAVLVVGPNAEATLSAGCPQNLSLGVFPVGACSRTLLGKVEIVVLRTAEDAFRVECWRSFSDYVFAFLADAAKDAAA